jgi:hypothetical protein
MTTSENHPQRIKIENGMAGGFWFAGWLFTLGFASLDWVHALVGLVIWPYYLALALK